jgi:tetratricopeptide (TPR) repeat protein
MAGDGIERYGTHRRVTNFQVIVAVIAGSAALPCARAVWRYFEGNLPGWAQGTIPTVFAAVALIPAILLVLRAVSRPASIATTPEQERDKIRIYIARLGEDEFSENARERIINSIVNELGQDLVSVVPADIELYRPIEEFMSDESSREADQRARSFLHEIHGDLLIWGKASEGAQGAQIDIRVASADSTNELGLSGAITLAANFDTEIGAALAGTIAARALFAVNNRGQYLVPTLLPLADRLTQFTQSIPQSIRPNDRATIFHSLGLIQYAIGRQSGESGRIHQAVACFKQVLPVWTQENQPHNWATAQNNIGNALSKLGERADGISLLEHAVESYHEALNVFRRESDPFQWAEIQNNLGIVLLALGERQTGTARLDQAVTALRQAVNEITFDHAPLQWATIQVNLAATLNRLSERQGGTAHLTDASAACKEALRVFTRDRAPLDWAATQHNLGGILRTIGERDGLNAPLEEAIAVYREALKERTRDRVPLDWAMTQTSLGNALGILGEREGGVTRLKESVAAFTVALEVLTAEFAPHYRSMALTSLAMATELVNSRQNARQR